MLCQQSQICSIIILVHYWSVCPGIKLNPPTSVARSLILCSGTFSNCFLQVETVRVRVCVNFSPSQSLLIEHDQLLAERDLVLGVMRGKGDLYEFIRKTRIRIEVNTLLFVPQLLYCFPRTPGSIKCNIG